jgi:hypothetical protein
MKMQHPADLELLTENLIPVIHLMNGKKISHTESFKEIALKRGITTQSVLDSCVRRIGLRLTKEFVELVRTNKIKKYLIDRYPDQCVLIDAEL